jgi:hypothetical protein
VCRGGRRADRGRGGRTGGSTLDEKFTVRDPLEDWIRKDTSLTDTFSLQYAGVDARALA